MNAERNVIDWLHAEAPHNAPPQLLTRTLEKVAVLPQERVLWRRRPVTRGNGSRPLLLVGASLVGLSLLGASLAFVGGRTPPPLLAPSDPLPSPVAQRLGLAYGLDGDIFVSNWDGSDPVRIADGAPPDRSVSTCGAFSANRGLTSPDGRYIAYRGEWSDECPGLIYLADSTGELIASVEGIGWEISWSPDSTGFVTWLSLWSDVVVYGIDGSRQAVIEGSNWCCGDFDPIWSPDGSASILVRRSGGVHELPLDGGPARAMTTTNPGDPRLQLIRAGSVAYSPDGTQAAFVESDALILSDRTGSNRQTLIPSGPDLQRVVWSPIGDQIAYVETRTLTRDAEGIALDTAEALKVVAPGSGQVSTVFSSDRGSHVSALIGFSPDGERLLFMGSIDQESALWSVRNDGSEARMLVEGADGGGWLYLPPD